MTHETGHAHAGAAGPVGPALPRHVAPQMLEVLHRRRSLPLRALVEPGPDAEDLRTILSLAARVPDHGRLVPWRFIVLKGEARSIAGERLDTLYAQQNPELPAAKATMWREYLLRAPVTVVLVSRSDPKAKIPRFNQDLSAGAAGMALVTAAAALGFATQWLLKWPGRDPQAAALLGVLPEERVAGFIHIGSPAEVPPDRSRPSLDDVVTWWNGA
ncbi:MAG: nitroreductase [Pseudomonadota bacterium]